MQQKKVLIVDDEPDILAVLSRRLVESGFRVFRAGCGKEAIERAKKELPDLIILDIIMPDMGGEEVERALKAEPLTKSIPVIFLTCLFTKDDELRDGHSVGKNLFVAKPYDVQELLELINKTVAGK